MTTESVGHVGRVGPSHMTPPQIPPTSQKEYLSIQVDELRPNESTTENDTPAWDTSHIVPQISTPQHWRCDLCTFTYTSPLPLAHPPNHRCAPPGRIPRIRKMTDAEGETR